MFCGKCGNNIPDGAVVCPACGAPTGAAPAPGAKKPNKNLIAAIVGVVVIAICFAISLLGLGNIIKYAYGYDGYYAILVIIIPAFVWGLPKIKKLEAEKKAQLSE